MMFSNLPTRPKLIIFQFLINELNDDQAKMLATVNAEFANFTSISRTKSWTQSEKNAKKWINLLPAQNKLEFQVFPKPIPVLRVDTQATEIIAKNGFRRRGVQPQFLPDPFYTLMEYQETIAVNVLSGRRLAPVDAQAPWSTMVCNWNFSNKDQREKQFKDATNWEPNLEEAQIDEAVTTWVYFAVIYEGIVNSNSFDERTVFGIPTSDIIGAIDSFSSRQKPKFWLNNQCTLAQHEPELYNEILDFIYKKVGQTKPQEPLIKKSKPNSTNDFSTIEPNRYRFLSHSDKSTDDNPINDKLTIPYPGATKTP